MQLHVRIIQDDDRAFIATADEYPDLLASGFTFEELREAVEEQISWFSGQSVKISPESFSQLSVDVDVTLIGA